MQRFVEEARLIAEALPETFRWASAQQPWANSDMDQNERGYLVHRHVMARSQQPACVPKESHDDDGDVAALVHVGASEWTVTHHAVFSPSYGVPVLYVEAFESTGTRA